MWLLSPKVLPIIMLVVIPISIAFMAIALSYIVPHVFVYTELSPEYGTIFSYLYLISASSLIYAFYFIRFGNIKKRGFSNLLVEQDYIKITLFIEVPILVFVTYLSTAHLLPSFENTQKLVVQDFLNSLLTSIGVDGFVYGIIFPEGLMINLGFSVTAGIIWLILVAARKELGYYFAKTLFQTATYEREESKKAQYFVKATKSYDKYLRRTLNLEIKDTKRVYSKILADSSVNRTKSIQEISDSFGSSDKLAPINCLSKIVYVKEEDTFLVEESISKKIKDMAIFFATIIPVAVGVIQLWLKIQ